MPSLPLAPDAIADAIARGDHRAALAECARSHGVALGRLCMAWLGSQAEADEATQETLLAAYDAMRGSVAYCTIVRLAVPRVSV